MSIKLYRRKHGFYLSRYDVVCYFDGTVFSRSSNPDFVGHIKIPAKHWGPTECEDILKSAEPDCPPERIKSFEKHATEYYDERIKNLLEQITSLEREKDRWQMICRNCIKELKP